MLRQWTFRDNRPHLRAYRPKDDDALFGLGSRGYERGDEDARSVSTRPRCSDFRNIFEKPDGKWTRGDSNPRLPPCEGGDLPLIYLPVGVGMNEQDITFCPVGPAPCHRSSEPDGEPFSLRLQRGAGPPHRSHGHLRRLAEVGCRVHDLLQFRAREKLGHLLVR